MLRILGRSVRSVLFGRRADRSSGNGPEVLIVPSGVRASLEGDNLVFLHIGKGLVYKSNLTGTRIWRGLMKRQPPRLIAEQLSKEYGVPQEQVERHVTDFVADLRQHGLIAFQES
jgi:hypothetical protein